MALRYSREDLDVFDFNLTAEQMESLDRIASAGGSGTSAGAIFSAVRLTAIPAGLMLLCSCAMYKVVVPVKVVAALQQYDTPSCPVASAAQSKKKLLGVDVPGCCA